MTTERKQELNALAARMVEKWPKIVERYTLLQMVAPGPGVAMAFEDMPVTDFQLFRLFIVDLRDNPRLRRALPREIMDPVKEHGGIGYMTDASNGKHADQIAALAKSAEAKLPRDKDEEAYLYQRITRGLAPLAERGKKDLADRKRGGEVTRKAREANKHSVMALRAELQKERDRIVTNGKSHRAACIFIAKKYKFCGEYLRKTLKNTPAK